VGACFHSLVKELLVLRNGGLCFHQQCASHKELFSASYPCLHWPANYESRNQEHKHYFLKFVLKD